MKIVISNTSDIPLYQQIKDQIKDAILKEELGLVPVRSEKSVEIAYATAEQAQLLGINKGAALFLMPSPERVKVPSRSKKI